jgi:glycerol-3-phosphate dehydrogenase
VVSVIADPLSPPQHVVEVNKATGLVSILGGKWTTYRKMAEDAVDAVRVGAAHRDTEVGGAAVRWAIRVITLESALTVQLAKARGLDPEPSSTLTAQVRHGNKEDVSYCNASQLASRAF